MYSGLKGRDLALGMMRNLPRVEMSNLKPNPGSRQKKKFGRGQHGGDTHGGGLTSANNRIMRLGYETGNTPFYQRFQYEPYYKGHHLRREYPPLSLKQLQMMVDTNRIDTSKPIDLPALLNTNIYKMELNKKHSGVQITSDGADSFTAKVNLEVQWAPEAVIAAVERNGGVITTAFYDPWSVHAFMNPLKFFAKGEAIPRRMLPPMDCLEYYSRAESRGYLADPAKVSRERLVLAQKYGYELPKIEDDPEYEMLMERKDPRQIFYGLQPGWVVNLKDKMILKPKAEYLTKYYSS